MIGRRMEGYYVINVAILGANIWERCAVVAE